MSEPLIAEQLERIKGVLIGPWDFNETLPENAFVAVRRPDLRAVLARLEWLEAKLASIGPWDDMLLDNQAWIEMGAARQREADRVLAASMGATHVAGAIRASGPCLPPPPDEGELQRLREALARIVADHDSDMGFVGQDVINAARELLPKGATK